MKNFKIIVALISLISVPVFSQQAATTVDQLLDRVQQGKINDNKENNYFKIFKRHMTKV